VRFFKPNADFDRELARDPDIQDGMATFAKLAVPTIEEMARQAGEPFLRRPGHELIEVQVDDGVFIVNTDYGAHWAEYGSRNTAIHAPLRRGVRQVGFRLVEDPKP